MKFDILMGKVIMETLQFPDGSPFWLDKTIKK